MGRIISNFFISLDGVVERPDQWHFPYFDDDMGAIVGAGMGTTGAFLLGRHLYDEWSEYWPSNTDEEGFKRFITNIPKYVVTHRPIEGDAWNNTTVIADDHVAQVQAVKDSTADHCARASVSMIARDGLLDELCTRSAGRATRCGSSGTVRSHGGGAPTVTSGVWAAAVHAGDLEAVLAGHADDIVMFDVPPPDQGLRGIEAYRATWPPFFEWQRQGAVFEIESLDITAGEDIAFAHALLRCDSPEGLAATPDRRLRLTLGLRREQGGVARRARAPLVPVGVNRF